MKVKENPHGETFDIQTSNPAGIKVIETIPYQLKQDVCMAINLLIQEGVFNIETFTYMFVIDNRGRERVMTWDAAHTPVKDEQGRTKYHVGDMLRAPTYDDPREFIVSAGRLSKVRGKTD